MDVAYGINTDSTDNVYVTGFFQGSVDFGQDFNMKDKKITIKEVAKLAGVSNSTVSRVLTGSAPVNDDIRQRILRVIEETNYYPNVSARALSGRKTDVIGVLLNSDPDYHFSDFVSMETLRGITASAVKIDLRVTIIPARLSDSYERLKAERQLDGLIVMGLHKTETVLDSLNKNWKKEIPIVLLKLYIQDRQDS